MLVLTGAGIEMMHMHVLKKVTLAMLVAHATAVPQRKVRCSGFPPDASCAPHRSPLAAVQELDHSVLDEPHDHAAENHEVTSEWWRHFHHPHNPHWHRPHTHSPHWHLPVLPSSRITPRDRADQNQSTIRNGNSSKASTNRADTEQDHETATATDAQAASNDVKVVT